MRFAIAAMVAAGLIATAAIAQDTNEANTADPAEEVQTAPENAVVEPALPVTNEPAPVATPLDPVEETEGVVTARRERGFPWGLIGLIGLVGLLGRRRS